MLCLSVSFVFHVLSFSPKIFWFWYSPLYILHFLPFSFPELSSGLSSCLLCFASNASSTCFFLHYHLLACLLIIYSHPYLFHYSLVYYFLCPLPPLYLSTSPPISVRLRSYFKVPSSPFPSLPSFCLPIPSLSSVRSLSLVPVPPVSVFFFNSPLPGGSTSARTPLANIDPA